MGPDWVPGPGLGHFSYQVSNSSQLYHLRDEEILQVWEMTKVTQVI